MQAMVLNQINTPLVLTQVPLPQPANDEILIKIEACAICRTDLHIIEGELPAHQLPLILGHQPIGRIIKSGPEVKLLKTGQRVGATWLANTCGRCEYCQENKENLCNEALFRGYDLNGGFAEYCLIKESFAVNIPKQFSSIHAAPLLCAGVIGYRALSLAGTSKKIGFFGFGSSAHILIQLLKYQQREIYAFTRPGDIEAQLLATALGAQWVGSSTELPPVQLDAAIIFASAGELIPQALRSVKKGGKVICAGIHMSDIPTFPYEILFGERSIQSVTNLTREDAKTFFQVIKNIPIQTKITTYPLFEANRALRDLKKGSITGSAVLEL